MDQEKIEQDKEVYESSSIFLDPYAGLGNDIETSINEKQISLDGGVF